MPSERTLRGKTLMITGASRGIGKAIALRAAQDGANVAILAKTTTEHPKLPGTIHTAAEEMEAVGGRALAVRTDIRDDGQVQAAVEATAAAFGGIDIVVNNASALCLDSMADITMKMYDRIWDINARGSFLVTKTALPYLIKGNNPHILNISPPLSLTPRWYQGHAAYTFSKFAMSAWIMGWAQDLAESGVACNALWPFTTIDTAAVRNLLGGEKMANASRKPAIMGEAAWSILTRDSRACTGNFFTDEQVLTEEGITDLESYAVKPGTPLYPDFFLD